MITPKQAAIAFGMNERQAENYLNAIAERDDYLSWVDADDGSDWVIHPVAIPFGTPLHVDTTYDEQCWVIPGGGIVYVSEPDCIVSVEHRPGRFVVVAA